MNAFSWAKKAGAKTVGVFVITRKNVHELEGAIKVCVALGLDGILINRIYPTGRGLENIEELKIGKEDIERALAVADEAVGLYGIIAFIGTIIHPCIIDLKKYKNLKFHTCPAGTTKGYYTVDPLGNLRVCNNSPEIVGNLFETPFWELHKSEKVKKFMEAHPEMCEPCKLKNICQGGCKACSWICSGDICTPEPFLRDNAQHVKCFK